MRLTILSLLLVLPVAVFGQSLAEVAKKEKERRESNKKEGKEVTVLTEDDAERLRPAETTVATGDEESQSGGTYTARSEEYSSEEDGESSEEDVPTFIPPDRPLADRLDMFERMKRHYLAQVKEIDEEIQENEAKIRKAQSDLAATSAAGGGGLPVAPGAAPVGAPLTGQESAALADELNRLQAMNDQLRSRKDQLRLDLQSKGRAAAIPAGYLRF